MEQFLISLGKKGLDASGNTFDMQFLALLLFICGDAALDQARCWCRDTRATVISRGVSASGVPSWSHVEKLLALTDTERPSGVRDRAILMLLAIYGLRRSEVHRLRLEDLDWERRLLLVAQSKQGCARIYPLIVSVAEAIARYLREVRPHSTYREVFLILRAPYTPIVPGSLYMVVASKLRHLGISLPHMGPHTPASCLCDTAHRAGVHADRSGRPSWASDARCHAHLCEGGRGGTARSRQSRSGRVAMKLATAMSRYVTYKQSIGMNFETPAAILRALLRQVGENTSIQNVTRQEVLGYLNGSGPVTEWWHSKYHALKCFWAYSVQHGWTRCFLLSGARSPTPSALRPVHL